MKKYINETFDLKEAKSIDDIKINQEFLAMQNIEIQVFSGRKNDKKSDFKKKHTKKVFFCCEFLKIKNFLAQIFEKPFFLA